MTFSRSLRPLHFAIVTILLSAAPWTASRAEVGKNEQVLNANLATLEEIVGAGLTEDQAQAVIDARPHLNVLGLKEALDPELSGESLEAAFRSLFVPLNLNTASNDAILNVPGVGPRMAHEFEEYRPYIAMAQFRREIGKYVDDGEVARLERYFFIGD